MIEVRNLSFRYTGRREPALRDVSFGCRVGEVLLVMGPSGCGKSTLALCLNGAIPHSIAGDLSGSVTVDGLDSRASSMAALAERVGLVFQDPEAQFCMPRVADEVAFGLENLAVPPGEMDARIDTALAQVGLADRRWDRIDQLSGGQKQRLALACVLAQGPRTLVFDEPTAQLDPAGSAEVLAVLGQMRASRRHAIVLIEHRLDDVMPLVDRCLALTVDGRVAAEGEPRDVLRTHGPELLAAGVWVPQVTELGLRLGTRPLPLTVAEAAETLAGKLEPAEPRQRGKPGGDSHATAGAATYPDELSEGQLGEPAVDSAHAQAPDPIPGSPGEFHLHPRDASVAIHESRGGSPQVRVRELSYRYSGSPRLVLDGVSVEAWAGEFIALVGPNGAGKSTLARVLAGILPAPKGAVEVSGRAGYVFQYPEHQFVASTAAEDVAYGPRRQGAPADEARRAAEEALAEFGLGALAEAHPFQLSLGEQRRLSVADMVVLQPSILILDEPTFGQDRASAASLAARMVELAKAGSLVIAITHDVKLVARAQRVLALAGGRLVFDGSPGQLFGDPVTLARTGLTPPPVWQLSERLGLEPRALDLDDLQTATLERTHEVVRLA